MTGHSDKHKDRKKKIGHQKYSDFFLNRKELLSRIGRGGTFPSQTRLAMIHPVISVKCGIVSLILPTELSNKTVILSMHKHHVN